MPDFATAGGVVGSATGLGGTSRVAAGTICCGETGLGNGVGIGAAAGMQPVKSNKVNRLLNRKIGFRLRISTLFFHTYFTPKRPNKFPSLRYDCVAKSARTEKKTAPAD
jgi:hypothetical protein